MLRGSRLLEEIADKIKAIIRRNPSLADVAQWLGGLLSETVTAQESPSIPDLNPDQKCLPDAWSEGKPLLDLGKLSLDWEQAEMLFKRLVKWVETSRNGERPVRGLMQALAWKQINTLELMRALLISDFKSIENQARDIKCDPAVLILLLRMSIRPSLLNAAGKRARPSCGYVQKLRQLYQDPGPAQTGRPCDRPPGRYGKLASGPHRG